MLRSLSTRMLGLRADARSAIRLAARHGFEGVELPVRDLVERGDDLDAIASPMADLGIRVGTWPLPVDWRGDADRFAHDLRRLPEYARAAQRLGLDRTGTWVLPEILDPDLLGRPSPAEATLDRHVERLAAIATILGDHGHRLGLEAIGVASSRTGRGLRFIDRLSALDPLLDALAAKGLDVGLTVDAFHLFAAGEPPETATHRGVGAIVTVHLSDLPEGEPPDPGRICDDRRALPRALGAVPCSHLLRCLADAGYAGPVFAEPMPGGGLPPRLNPATTRHDAIVRRAKEALTAIWPADVRSLST